MARYRGWLGFALGIVVAGVAWWGFSAMRTARQDAESSTVATLLKAQEACWNVGDLEGFMRDYDMSDDTTMYSGGDVRQGWVTIMDRYRKRYQADGATMGKLQFTNLQVQVLGHDSAMARGTWTVELPGSTPTGLFTLILRKRDGAWKIVHDHTSAAEKK